MTLSVFARLFQRSRGAPARRLVAAALVLAVAASVLVATAALRGPEYDEGYTVFIAAGHRRPAWPVTFRAGEVRGAYAGASSMAGIARALRDDDVHPPLYFWAVAAWRAAVGTGLFATRLFSVVCALVSLALVGALARRLGRPVAAAMALTLGCYGFAYAGAIARDYAMAQTLCLAGLWFAVGARDRNSLRDAALAGGAYGLAVLTGYLAAFPAAAGLAWLARRPRLVIAAAGGFAPALPVAWWFLAAQHGARDGQFPPFARAAALLRLARYQLAAAFGGLPLYAGAAGPAVAALVVLLAAGLAVALAWQWGAAGRARGLLLATALAPAAGLYALCAATGAAAIELRYLVLGLPAAALLVAGLRAPRLRAVTLAVQAAAVAGLMLRPETMQPQGEAAREAAAAGDALVLLPRGNDGVGVVGAFVAAAPDAMRVRLVGGDARAGALRAAIRDEPRVAVVLLGLDASSRAALRAVAAVLDDPCWRRDGGGPWLRVWTRICPRGDAAAPIRSRETDTAG